MSHADGVNITLLGEPNIVDKRLARAREDAIMGEPTEDHSAPFVFRRPTRAPNGLVEPSPSQVKRERTMGRVWPPRRVAIIVVAAGLFLLTAGVSYAQDARSTGPHWAAVRSDGTILASSAGVSAGAHGVAGRYDLAFPQDVSRCAIVATSGIAGDRAVGDAAAGLQIVVRGGYFSSRDRMSVLQTRNGTPADYAFSIIAYC